MDKKTKPRLAFVTCFPDPWIEPILEDVYQVCQESGYEVFFISRFRHGFPGYGQTETSCSIDLNYEFSDPLTWPGARSTLPKGIEIDGLIELEVEFLKRMGRTDGASPEQIARQFQDWAYDAMMICKLIQPDLVITWNGLVSQRAVYATVARYLDIPLFYAEKGMLPDSWYIDPLGINPLSTVARSGFDPGKAIEEKAIEKIKQKIAAIDISGNSAWEQPEREMTAVLKEKLGIPGERKVIFFPGQVDNDSNIILFSPHFDDTLQALTWLTRDCSAQEFFILVKPHSKGFLDVDSCNQVLGDRGIALSDINVLDAIEIADCVVSINSTVIFEAVVHRTPALALGESVLSHQPFVTSYSGERSSAEWVNECINNHSRNQETFYRQVLEFAAYLDSRYYAYRGQPATAGNILAAAVSSNSKPAKEKTFTLEEIAAIFHRPSSDDLFQTYPGRLMLDAVKEKVRRRLRS